MSVTDTDYPPAVTIKSRNDDAVTDAENGADAHFESRNDDAVTDAEGGGAPSFESRNDATARIDALLGLTGKVETPEEKELFWRAYNAQKTAEHCGKCGRVISPD